MLMLTSFKRDSKHTGRFHERELMDRNWRKWSWCKLWCPWRNEVIIKGYQGEILQCKMSKRGDSRRSWKHKGKNDHSSGTEPCPIVLGVCFKLCDKNTITAQTINNLLKGSFILHAWCFHMWMDRHHICIWCLRSAEEDIGSPGTGVTEGCEAVYGFWEWSPGALLE